MAETPPVAIDIRPLFGNSRCTTLHLYLSAVGACRSSLVANLCCLSMVTTRIHSAYATEQSGVAHVA